MENKKLDLKKIIIVNNNLEIGGVQTSLINLLKEISDKYDVTLLLFHAKPNKIAELPEKVNVIVINSPFKHFGMSSKDCKPYSFTYFARAFWVILAKCFGRSFIIKFMFPFQKKYRGYDCAISFLHEGNPQNMYGGCNEFVLRKIEADQKIGWVHCDFGLCGADIKKSRKIYERFDKIVACSDGCKSAFLNCYPEFVDKTFSVRNCNDYERIGILSQNNSVEYDKSCFNIVTVARLSQEKAIERAIVAISECIKLGYIINYHIVGAGSEEDFLRKKVIEMGLEKMVKFYGNQSNPYPYIKKADLFLLTSHHEAAPMVFDEAKFLGIPILATKTTSTYEMIEKDGCGIVCENTQDDITKKMVFVLSSSEALPQIRDNLKKIEFSNDKSVKDLTNVLG